MVRKYIKKQKTENWFDGDMILAINEVKSGKSIRYAAKKFGLPRTTLQKKLSDIDAQVKGSFKKGRGFTQTFTSDQEAVLVQYICDIEKNLQGLSAIEVRRLAYQLAVKFGIKNNFSKDKGLLNIIILFFLFM